MPIGRQLKPLGRRSLLLDSLTMNETRLPRRLRLRSSRRTRERRGENRMRAVGKELHVVASSDNSHWGEEAHGPSEGRSGSCLFGGWRTHDPGVPGG